MIAVVRVQVARGAEPLFSSLTTSGRPLVSTTQGVLTAILVVAGGRHLENMSSYQSMCIYLKNNPAKGRRREKK